MQGRFIAGPAIKPVYVGDWVKATVGYWALNPGAWWWKTVLLALCWNRVEQALDITREIGQEAGRTKTYLLGDGEHGVLKMPDLTIAITFYLFGHDDANYWFDWDDFWAYFYGWDSAGLTPLCYATIYLSPRLTGEPPQPPAMPEHQIVYTPTPEGVVEEEKPIIPPPVGKKLNFVPVLLIGGGAVLVATSARKKFV